MENNPCNNYWTSAAVDKINASLLKFHKKNVSLTKDRSAGMGGGKSRMYVTLDNILNTVRPILAELDLFIEQHLAGDTVITKINHVSGQFIASSVHFQAWNGQGTNNLQNAGGGLTYLKRYCLSAILALAADEDNDAADTPVEVKKPAQQPAKAAKKPLTNYDGAVAALRGKTVTLAQLQAQYDLTEDQLIGLQDASKTVAA